MREELARTVAELPLEERIELAFRLGEADLALYQAAHGVDREAALTALRRQRQVGRRPSRCAAESGA